MPKRERRHARLLADPDVKKWYNNLCRGSKATADNYLSILGRFCEWGPTTPGEFVATKPKARDDSLDDWIQEMIDAGRSGSYIDGLKKAVVSWLAHHGETLHRKIKVPGVSRRPSMKDKYIPSPEEFRRAIDSANARARAAMALIAFSGQRLEVLGTYEGDDGVRLGDFPELELRGDPRFTKVPTRIEVREELSKTKKPYFAFLGPEGCDYVLAYLRARKAGGERLSPTTPLIVPDRRQQSRWGLKPIRTINIGDIIRNPIGAAGLKMTPYMLRSYFSTHAQRAEPRLLKDYREFLMGHGTDISGVYALEKRLPKEKIEEMRKAYEAALEFLETRATKKVDMKAEALKAFLLAYGYKEKDLEGRSVGELQTLIRSGPIQKVVRGNDLEALLAQGWQFRATLPDGRAVVENPRGPLP